MIKMDWGKLAEGLDRETFQFVEDCVIDTCSCGDTLAPCGNHVEVDPSNPCEDCEKLKKGTFDWHDCHEGNGKCGHI